MTDYCSSSELAPYYSANAFSTTTTPTLVQVGTFITRSSAYIDEELDGLYSTPLSGTNTLSLAKRICIYLTVAEIDEARQLSIMINGNIDRATRYRDLADKLLSDIKSGDKVLSDATPKTSIGGFYSYNDDNDIEAELSTDDNF